MRSSLILGVFLLALAPSSPAQEVSGIRGKVVTDENRPLVDAEILIEIAGHNSIPQSVHTDVGGDYQTSNLQPGIYNLEIRAKNFGSVALRGVQVQIGKVTVVPATPLDLSAGLIVACPSDPRPDYYRLATGNSHTGAIAGIVTDDKRVAVRGGNR